MNSAMAARILGNYAEGEWGIERGGDIAQYRRYAELYVGGVSGLRLNGYQQDSYEMVDPDDIALNGADDVRDVDGAGPAAVRSSIADSQIQPRQIDPGNTYIAFQTSIKTFGVSPGDLITVTYLKEGFLRQPFRVLKNLAGDQLSNATITAQTARRCLVRGH
jgi:hypothetical protein